MVTLYLAKTVDLSLERLESISEERQQRIQRCKDSETKKQILTAGLLLEEVFILHKVERNTLYKNSFGKLMADGIQFNLSHTDGLVICAVSKEPVGCDVELMKQAPKGIAERFFHENEKLYLEQNREKQDELFFRLWTMKESYVKMTGEGLRLAMQDFEVRLESEESVFRNGEKQDCSLKEYRIPGYQIAVCSEEKQFSELIWVTL